MHHSDNNDFSAIKESLVRFRREFILLNLLSALAIVAIACFGLLTLVQIVFAVFPWSLLPVLWDAVVALFMAMTIGFVIDKCFLHRRPLLRIAAILEQRFRLKPRWLSLSLELQSPSALGSEALKNDVVSNAKHSLEGFPSKIPIRLPPLISATLLAMAAVWGITTVSLRPRCAAFWDLPLSFGATVSGRVFPGTITIPMKASIDLRCVPRGRAYPSCRLFMTGLDDNITRSTLLRPDDSGSFCLHYDHCTGSFAYQFSLGARLFPAETVYVAAKPSIYSMRIRVTPPAYVGLPAALLQEGQGNFSAFAGSAALFSLSASGPLARAVFCPSAGDTVFFNVNGNEARGEVKILRSCSYTFSLVDTFGQQSDSLPSFFIDRIADEVPLVHFLKPGINKELMPALAETLWIEALDDIGIKECSLRWRKNIEPHDTAHVRDLLGNRPQTELRRQMVWDVRELFLYPGDTLFYWAYVRDNDPYDKTHFSVSQTYWLRLPTFEEIHERLARQQDETEHSLQSAQEKQDALRGTLSDLIKSTKGKESLTWEQKQIVNDLKESLKAQSDTLNKAVEALKRTVEQLKENGLSSKDIIDKMDKVRKALEDLARDYGDSVLFERPRQNESVGIQELKESLEKIRKMLPDLAQRLDNALKYLDMLKRDRQLADLAERAEKYGKEQMDLAARSPKGPPWNERQKELTKKIEALLSDVSRQSDTGNQSPLFSKEEVPSLQHAASQLQAMKNGFSQTGAQAEAMDRMSADLFSLAQNLRDLQSSAMAAKLKKEKETLMDMAHDALNMAQWQEEMAIESRQSPDARGKTALSQQALKQALFNSAGNLNKLAMTPPQTVRQLMKRFDDAGTDIDKSVDAVKNATDAFDAMKAAEGGLNGLAFSLLEAAAAMEGEAQGGGMGEMMGGFQRLSGKQAMINFATGQILRQMLGEGESMSDDAQKAGEGGEGRSSGQIEKARKEAQQAQQAIADALQKLADSYGKEAGDGMNKKARDLEEEARRLARMLENPKPEIQDRQQRFLSRMLQTTLSMHKQDEGKEKRNSQSAERVFSGNVQKTAPDEFSDRDAFFQMRQKAFSGNFPESYRFSIKRYFDSLGVLFLKEK